MLREQLRLAVHQLRIMGCERFGDPGMQLPSRPAQQGAVGRILDQGMLEKVHGLRRCSALKDQAGIDEALERVLEPLVSEFTNRSCQFVGEFAADRRADLGDPFCCRAEPVEPRHQ